MDIRNIVKPQANAIDTDYFLSILPAEKQELHFAVIDQDIMTGPRYYYADENDTRIDDALRYLSHWPAVDRQFHDLMIRVCPMIDTDIHENYRELAVGSTSFSQGLPFGYICTTIDHPIGTAQAFVHEMAHHKLRLIGLSESSANSLILNESHERLRSFFNTGFISVNESLHDIYSFCHVLQLNLKLAKLELEENYQLILKNSYRLRYAHQNLFPFFKTDKQGKIFIDELKSWLTELLREAEEILSETEYKLIF